MRYKKSVVCAFAGLLSCQGLMSQDDEEDIVVLDAFNVVGSHLMVTEVASDSNITPVEVIFASEFDEKGFSTAAEVLQNLSANNGGSVPISNNATGFVSSASSASLRGLGPEATLVLINGRRVAPFPRGDEGTTAFVDLNTFPLAAIERVEVLKDGASAVYGADAVAGVVNIVTKRNFEGSELTVKYGNTTSKDSGELTVNFITGSSSEDSKVTAGFNYYKRNAIFNVDREYSKVPPFLSSNSSPLNFQISREAAELALGLAPGTAIPGVDDGVAVEDRKKVFFTSTFANRDNNFGNLPATDYTYSSGRTSAYNFNESSGSYPDYERKGAFLNWEKRIRGTEKSFIYGDVFFQQAYSVNQLAPSATGNFGNPGGVSLVIPANTRFPILTEDEKNAGKRTAAEDAYNPFNPFNQDFSGGTRARMAEFGNRIYRDTNDGLNGNIGFRTDSLFGDWHMDASLSYSRITNTARNTLVSISKFNRLVNANDPIFDPKSEDYIGTTTPYNPFGYYRNEIANNVQIAPFALVELKTIRESELYGNQVVISNNDVFRINDNPVGVAFGQEYRFETLLQSPDSAASSGDVIGSSRENITNADREIGSLFAEVNMPIITPENESGIGHALTVNLAGRYEDFVTQNDDIFVPKVSIRYLPFDESFAIRANWGEGYRQPSLYELYASGLTYSLTSITNPTTGKNEREQDVTTSSSKLLRAEESENTSFGLVWTPSFLKSDLKTTTFSLDFWEINRTGNVTVDHQDVVNRYDNKEALLPGESVTLLANGDYELVNGVFRNLGNENARGVDIAASQYINTEIGVFDIGVNASYLDSYEIQQFAGAPFFDNVGWTHDVLFDNETSDPSPGAGDDAYLEWKAEIFASYRLNNWSMNLTGHFKDGYQDFRSEWDPGNPNDPAGFNQVGSTTIWDFTTTYTFWKDNESWFGDTKVTMGIRNMFDKEPPFVSSWDNNSTGYSGFLYSSEGRFVFMSVTKKL